MGFSTIPRRAGRAWIKESIEKSMAMGSLTKVKDLRILRFLQSCFLLMLGSCTSSWS
jgi:hypothetical protein